MHRKSYQMFRNFWCIGNLFRYVWKSDASQMFSAQPRNRADLETWQQIAGNIRVNVAIATKVNMMLYEAKDSLWDPSRPYRGKRLRFGSITAVAGTSAQSLQKWPTYDPRSCKAVWFFPSGPLKRLGGSLLDTRALHLYPPSTPDTHAYLILMFPDLGLKVFGHFTKLRVWCWVGRLAARIWDLGLGNFGPDPRSLQPVAWCIYHARLCVPRLRGFQVSIVPQNTIAWPVKTYLTEGLRGLNVICQSVVPSLPKCVQETFCLETLKHDPGVLQRPVSRAFKPCNGVLDLGIPSTPTTSRMTWCVQGLLGLEGRPSPGFQLRGHSTSGTFNFGEFFRSFQKFFGKF